MVEKKVDFTLTLIENTDARAFVRGDPFMAPVRAHHCHTSSEASTRRSVGGDDYFARSLKGILVIGN